MKDLESALSALMGSLTTEGWEAMNFTALRASIPEELHAHFPDKKSILKQFQRRITQKLQETLKTEDLAEATPEERLQETILCRLELLVPYKKALQRLHVDLKEDPFLAKEFFTLSVLETRWLQEGTMTILQEKSLSLVYWLTVRTWLQDDSPHMEKTMAFLDKCLSVRAKFFC